MHQTWHDLLFMHWRVPPRVMRAVVPDSMPVDTFDGDAWIGVVPFEMRDVRPRFLPAVPRLSFFPELNVRTYVTLNDRPGVYFFSLDASNPIAVELARKFFHLPYQNATMECVEQDGWVEYGSTRTDTRGAPAYFRARYRPTDAPFIASIASLEYFLTARYCLYTTDSRGRVLRAEIHHAPWELQRAECETETNTMTQQINIELGNAKPHLLFAKQMHMVTWLPHPVV
jgi:uncharacterized protein YqjF (DUF2071 family)